MKRNVFVVLLASAVLQGCVFAPGQHMTPSNVGNDEEVGPVNVVQITSQTVSQQRVIYQAPPVPSELTHYVPEEYRIGPGDGLLITVWDHMELNSPASQDTGSASSRIVRDDGTLYYPYIDSVKAGGKTTSELREELREKLSKYLTGVQVDVKVQDFASHRVILSGAFKTPGPLVLNNVPITLVDAISRAGGDAGDANLAGLLLKRDGREYQLDIDSLNRKDSVLNQIYLKEGDQLHLGNNRGNRIYVLGEVSSPQVMNYGTSTFNLMEALGNAGGLNQDTANAEAVYVIRGAQNTVKQPATVFYLNAKKPTAFILARQFDLQASDVVFVGPANITRWNRFISQLLPSAGIVTTSAALKN
jgi:polysaccharide export outer membrane protein